MENDVNCKFFKSANEDVSNKNDTLKKYNTCSSKKNNPSSIHKDESTKLLCLVNSNLISFTPQNQSNHSDYSTINEKSIILTSQTTSFDLYKGFIYMFGSCFVKSLFSILCKFELDRNIQMTSFHLLTFKAYFMLIITVLVTLYNFIFNRYNRQSSLFIFSKEKINWIALRAVLSVISISLTIFALKYISISEVYSVFYIYPGIVMLLSYFILREKVGVFDFICLISCFIGVLLIIRPALIFPENKNTHGHNVGFFLLVILGALLKACEDIIIRNTGKDVNFIVIPCIYSVIAMVLYPLTLAFSTEKILVNLDLTDFFLIIMIASFSFIYQAFMSLAIQNENAGRVSMVNYLQVFFMFISDMFIFNRKMIFYDILGTFLILIFNSLNGISKVLKRQENLKKYNERTKNKISREV